MNMTAALCLLLIGLGCLSVSSLVLSPPSRSFGVSLTFPLLGRADSPLQMLLSYLTG
jgi:hypothetical protein